MTIDDLGSASERGCFLPLFFLYLYITIGDPNRTRRACTITTTTITTTTTAAAAAAAATTTRLDRLFPLRGQFYPSRSPPLSTPLFYLFLDQDGAKSSVSLLPISFLLFLSSSSPPSLYTASLFRFFFFFRLSPPAHSVYLASISPCSRYSRVKHGREGDQTTTHAHALHLPKPRRLIRLRICDVSRVALGRAALP